MSIVTRYILKEHIGPFFFGFMAIVFVFLLNIVFRDLGRLLGKGLPARIIVEFFILNLAWILALAIPMSVLVSTLMAFGRLSADSEIAALKASGVHLYRLITPVLLVACLMAIGMVRFINTVLPELNHRVRLLYSDISRKRPTLTLEPHVFFDEIPKYSLLVHEVKGENRLKEIIINDYSDPKHSRTIIAERGSVEFSDEQETMVLTLFNGEIHDADLAALDSYRWSKFQQQIFSIPVPNMVLKRSNSKNRGEREKTIKMMKEDIQRNLEALRLRENQIREIVNRDLNRVFPGGLWPTDTDEVEDRPAYPNILDRDVQRKIQQKVQQIQGELRIIKGYRRSISSLRVEIHKKYSIPVACIVFVLIGAPLGIMARQGGLAIGGGLSLIFFLIYWAFLIGGEQLADRMIIGPVLAMWAPNVLVGMGGIYLVVRSVRESTFIHWERWGQWIKSMGRGGRK